MKLILTDSTPLKSWPWDAKTLTDRTLPVDWKQRGDEFHILDFWLWEGSPGDGDDHISVLLTNGVVRYVYSKHCRIDDSAEGSSLRDETPVIPPKRLPIIDRGRLFKVPGISNKIGAKDKIYKGSNFAWGEALGGGYRIPVDAKTTVRIVAFARYMDEVRSYLDDRPIQITSWYRPPYINRQVGGARYSQHLKGWAADFQVKGLDTVDVFERLKKFHRYGGLAPGNGFVHIDFPSDKSDGKPTPRRWRYPNGPNVNLW